MGTLLEAMIVPKHNKYQSDEPWHTGPYFLLPLSGNQRLRSGHWGSIDTLSAHLASYLSDNIVQTSRLLSPSINYKGETSRSTFLDQ